MAKSVINTPVTINRVDLLADGKTEPCTVLSVPFGRVPLMAVQGRLEMSDDFASLAKQLKSRSDRTLALTLEVAKTRMPEAVVVDHLIKAVRQADPNCSVLLVKPCGTWILIHVSKEAYKGASEKMQTNFKGLIDTPEWLPNHVGREGGYRELVEPPMRRVQRAAGTVARTAAWVLEPPLRWARNVADTMRQTKPEAEPVTVVAQGEDPAQPTAT